MTYIILYAALEGNDYVPFYSVALSKEDIPYIIKFAKDNYLACNFLIFEMGKEVTKEFVDIKFGKETIKEFIDNKK
nr:MAG TPA: hypothetical protein [Bacteriophage sp.]